MDSSQDNLNLTNNLEKKLSNNSKINFYSKEESLTNKRILIMKDVLELLKLNSVIIIILIMKKKRVKRIY